MASIIYSDYYLPNTSYSAMEVLKLSPRQEVEDDEFCEAFLAQSGLDKIFVEKEKNEVQVFEELFERFFKSTEIKAEDISHIFYVPIIDEPVMNNVYNPYILKEIFGMNACSVSHMVEDCTTVLQAIQYANALVNNGDAKNVVIISSYFGLAMENRYVGITVRSDGAGIMVVGNSPSQSEILYSKSIAEGKYSYTKYLNTGNQAWDMDIIKNGTDLIKEVADSCDISIKDINPIVMLNINGSGYYIYSKFLGISMNKLYFKSIPLGGHIATVDMIRNYTEVMRDGLVGESGYFMLYASGTVGDGLDSTNSVVLLRKNVL